MERFCIVLFKPFVVVLGGRGCGVEAKAAETLFDLLIAPILPGVETGAGGGGGGAALKDPGVDTFLAANPTTSGALLKDSLGAIGRRLMLGFGVDDAAVVFDCSKSFPEKGN